ncbi:MAG: phasin family protein, partial [Xanthomonadales bacterium]|nr:phasin family protein [Xanthomonadales bacterium]
MVKQVRSKKVAAKRVRAAKPAVASEGARKAWLAGLGAVAVVRKQGQAAYAAFVAEGERAQAIGEKRARELGKDVERIVTSRLQPVRKRFAEVRRRAEARLESGTGRVLSWLGVPSKGDVDALVKRVDSLSRQLR